MADINNLDEDDLSKPLPANADVNIRDSNVNFRAAPGEQVGLAQTEIDKKVVDSQLEFLNEHWIKTYWRPAMAWLYMAICFMDFIGFPFLAGVQPIVYKIVGIVAKYEPWVSLTLQNGGLVHAAFGAILGVAAWTRGQEKLKR